MTDQPTDKGGVRWAVGDVLQHPCGSQWELIEHLGGKHDDWRGRCIVGHPRPGYGSGENIGRERTFHREYMDRTFSKTLWPQPKEETGWEWPEEIDVMGNDSDAPPTSFGVWAPAGVHDLSKWETRPYVPKHLYEQGLKRREFTQQWYAERIRRITDTAKREGIWPEIACILANGTADPGEAPTYAQLLNSAKHRAEAAEQKLGEVEAALKPVAEIADELEAKGYFDDCWVEEETFPNDVELSVADLKRARRALAALQTSKPDPTQKGDE